MGKLIYPMNISVDNYMECKDGNLDWSTSDDECHLLVHPVILGEGKRLLPANIQLQMELLDEYRFESGVVHLRYQLIN